MRTVVKVQQHYVLVKHMGEDGPHCSSDQCIIAPGRKYWNIHAVGMADIVLLSLGSHAVASTCSLQLALGVLALQETTVNLYFFVVGTGTSFLAVISFLGISFTKQNRKKTEISNAFRCAL